MKKDIYQSMKEWWPLNLIKTFMAFVIGIPIICLFSSVFIKQFRDHPSDIVYAIICIYFMMYLSGGCLIKKSRFTYFGLWFLFISALIFFINIFIGFIMAIYFKNYEFIFVMFKVGEYIEIVGLISLVLLFMSSSLNIVHLIKNNEKKCNITNRCTRNFASCTSSAANQANSGEL